MRTSGSTVQRRRTSTSRPLYVVQEHYAGSWDTFTTTFSEKAAREAIRVAAIFREYSTWRYRKYTATGDWTNVDL